MPIDYKNYPDDWKLISKAVIKKAGNKCELCNADNYESHWKTGSKVVLTVHHIDCDKNNNSKFNLIALCQRCHLRLDLETHISKRHKVDKNYWIDKVKQLDLIRS
jgi:5-methylcytosine-specific restriction endonuclease McrA